MRNDKITPGVGIAGNTSGELRIYPVPATGRLFVDLPSPTEKITITDLTGRVIVQHRLPQQSAHTGLDLPDCPEGIYILRIMYPDETVFTGKILIGKQGG